MDQIEKILISVFTFVSMGTRMAIIVWLPNSK